MKEIILNSVKLCIITLIAGVLLGTVYEITKEPRKKQEEKSKNEAYAKVFRDASKFEEIQYDKDGLSKFLEENGYKKTVAYINEIVSANNESGETLGYVITVTDKEGYGGEIKFTLGIQNDGTINGISFLTLAETAGVGMKADEAKFKNQFAGMKAEMIEYVKSEKNADNQIDAISGATVTTNAVTNGVNTGILAFQYISSKDEANSNDEKNEDKSTDNIKSNNINDSETEENDNAGEKKGGESDE